MCNRWNIDGRQFCVGNSELGIIMSGFLILRGLPAANTLFKSKTLLESKAAIAKTEQPIIFFVDKIGTAGKRVLRRQVAKMAADRAFRSRCRHRPRRPLFRFRK